jgi:hypothetical protein
MFVCTMVLYKYMKSLWNDVHNLSNNTHMQSKIKFYYGIVYIANEGRHIIILEYYLIKASCQVRTRSVGFEYRYGSFYT